MKHKTLKTKHFIFLLLVAAFVIVLPFMPQVEIAGNKLSQLGMWSKGVEILIVFLGLILGTSSFFAWRGSSLAFRICQYWATFYAIIMAGMIYWQFPNASYMYYIFGFGWALVWSFYMRRWHTYV